MKDPLPDLDREDRLIIGAFGLGCLGVLGLIIAILGLTAWVIIRVTLHFT